MPKAIINQANKILKQLESKNGYENIGDSRRGINEVE